jgi:hypothetical protein
MLNGTEQSAGMVKIREVLRGGGHVMYVCMYLGMYERHHSTRAGNFASALPHTTEEHFLFSSKVAFPICTGDCLVICTCRFIDRRGTALLRFHC